MGGLSWTHWALVAVVALILFGGRGRLAGLMGDVGQGIRAFRDGLRNDSETGAGREP